ncbi:MAG TPA: AAA family ATPase [Planctomycetota bacterium]|nr:AAA family ATPase [Planctomycetota bacterium]
MRILAIRGRNLASLQRSFEVDFVNGPLAVGLFAITGPVGAGKSTLLDALCLALFDRTPRLSGRGGVLVGEDSEPAGDWLRSSDPRSLLRRDAAEGHAEADFTGRDGVRYRARWTVRRARRRPDGRVQEQEMTLVDLDRSVLVAGGRKTEVLAAIEARLGLDFGQFCRSVLLAQGDFAAFLRASPDERAKLLENLTGADVYRKLSRAAHEACKRRETELAALVAQGNAQVLLGDAERRALVDRVRDLEQESKTCQLGIEIAQGYVQWYQAATRLRQRENEACVALQTAVETVAAAVARKERHARLQQALPLVPRLEIVSACQAAMTRGSERLAAAERASREAEQDEAAVEQRLLDELAAWRRGAAPASVPPIVREFDRWADTLQQWSSALRDLQQSEAQLPRARQHAAAAMAGVASAERAVAEKKQSLEQAQQVTRTARAAATASEFAELATVRQQLAGARSVARARQDRFVEWQARCRELVDATAASQRKLQEREAAAAGFEDLVARRDDTEQALLAARARNDAVRTRVDLMQFRHVLEDGVPCPLCGAPEHPAPIEASDSELAAAQAAVARAEADFDEARQRVAQRELARVEAERAHTLAERALTAATAAEQAAHLAWALVAGEQRASMDVAAASSWIAREAEDLASREADFERLSNAADAARAAHDEALAAERRVAEQHEAESARWQAQKDAAVAARHVLDVATAENARRKTALAEIAARLAPAFSGIADWSEHVRAAGEQALAQLRSLALVEQQRALLEKAADEAAAAKVAAAADAARLQMELAAAEATFEKALQGLPVRGDDVREVTTLGAGWVREEADALRKLDEQVVHLRAVVQTCAQMRKQHEGSNRPAIEEADAAQAWDDARTARARVDAQLTDVRTTLAADDLLRRQRDELAPRIEAIEQALAVWRALDELIGSSGGDAFAVFAQGLTLELLLTEANRRLSELARRYRLHKNPGGEMDFVVIDLDLGGTRRSLQSLSGGETFLVSLALALALATLAAPRSRVETLFLDEGFGTLDAQHLEQALGALDTLQAGGCQVGVISHVDGIAERIGAVVEVQPEGGGQSRVLARVR